MRDEIVTYSMICRITALLYLPLCVACAVSFFFTANLQGFLCSLLTIPLILLPDAGYRFFHWKKSYPLNIIYDFMLLVCVSGGITFRLGRWIPFYPVFCDVVLVLFALLVGRILPHYLHTSRAPLHSRLTTTFSALFSIAISFLILFVRILSALVMQQAMLSTVSIAAELTAILISSIGFSLLFAYFPDNPLCAFALSGVNRFVKLNRKPAASTITILPE